MQVIRNIKTIYDKLKTFFASRFFSRLFATVLCLPIYSGEQETQRHLSGRVLPAAVLAFSVFGLFGSAPAFAADSKLDLTMSSDTISVDIGSANANGTFKKSANNTISVTTDHYTGYTLSIKSTDTSASTTSPALKNGSDAMPSITSSLTEEQFSSIGATNYNNKYGYLPSRICTNTNGCTSNTSFLPAPTLTGDILDKTTVANPSTANTYTMAIGARIDQTIPFGSYSNTFEVLLVANAIPYTIVYNDGVVSDMPVDVDTTSMTSSVTISSNTPVRDGYTFGGWCTVQVADNESCTGTTYAAGSTYTLDQTGTNNLQLFAMWSGSGGGGIGFMQNWSACDKMEIDDIITLVDSRDNERYRIGKLADGNCWMLDNLRLDLTNVSLDKLQGNTNASDQTLGYLVNGGGTASDQYAMSGIENLTLGNSYSNPRINASYVNVKYSPVGAGSGKTGVYYNYCAASAGSYCYGNGASTGTSEGDATEDICPAGWRMPTASGDSGGDYNSLYIAYSRNAADFRTALSFPLSGFFYNGSTGYQNNNGFFWSSSRCSNETMYLLNGNSSGVQTQNYFARYNGYSVRCLLQ